MATVNTLPTTEHLREGLASAFRVQGLNGHALTILDRELSPYSTTFPCEVVTCRVAGRKPQRVFCKYTAGVAYNGHGHRGRVGYEIDVYRTILARAKQFRPRFYGSYTDKQTGDHWLFLEYLDGSLRIGKLGLVGTPKAARWIGRFHAAAESRAARNGFAFLTKYDWDYYLGWVQRTEEFAGPLHRRYPWLRSLCRQARELLAPLVEMPPSVIHGEFYQHNVLHHRGQVCPIDWESAAIGNGLIDLATLTEGTWPKETVQACIREYQRARWPQGAPAVFNRAFLAANLYIHFRWLGDEKEVTCSRPLRGRFAALRNLGQQLGALI